MRIIICVGSKCFITVERPCYYWPSKVILGHIGEGKASNIPEDI